MFGEFEESSRYSTQNGNEEIPQGLCNGLESNTTNTQNLREDIGKCNGLDDISVRETEIHKKENYDLSLEDRIIDCIANRQEIIVKSQQRNEPDFTIKERKEIVSKLLTGSPSQFLYRFGKHLEREHLQYFDVFSGPEICFYVQETQKLLNDSTKKVKLRNRRFGAYCKMESSASCSYFSEDEMRKREPLLYQELIDKNLTDEERSQRHRQNNTNEINTFSDLLFEQIERNVVRDLRKEQEALEDDCYEEVDDDDDDDPEEEYEESSAPDEGEKELLRDEFRMAVCTDFLAGQDQEFDYSQVDEVEDNDLLDWESRDEEEKYFD